MRFALVIVFSENRLDLGSFFLCSACMSTDVLPSANIQFGRFIEHETTDAGDLFYEIDGSTFLSRMIGILSGFLFVIVGISPFVIDIGGELWVKAIFAIGFVLIGFALIWSNTGKQKKFYYAEIDKKERLLRFGLQTTEGARLREDAMALADIENMSWGADSASSTGYSVLYVSGKNAPHKGILLHGTKFELGSVAAAIESVRG